MELGHHLSEVEVYLACGSPALVIHEGFLHRKVEDGILGHACTVAQAQIQYVGIVIIGRHRHAVDIGVVAAGQAAAIGHAAIQAAGVNQVQAQLGSPVVAVIALDVVRACIVAVYTYLVIGQLEVVGVDSRLAINITALNPDAGRRLQGTASP